MESSVYDRVQLTTPHSIRDINLSGAMKKDDPLLCGLVETSLDNPIPYRALSYTWGSETRDRPLIVADVVDGQVTTIGHLQMTANCEAALRRLRPKSAKEVLHIWVDALVHRPVVLGGVERPGRYDEGDL